MSPTWICRNIADAWANRASLHDFWKRLCWVYAEKLPGPLRRSEQVIRFRFPPPVNQITVRVRSNGGSDAFVFGEVFHHNYYRLPLAAAPATILDLGANTGFTAAYFGRCFPGAQIACVEPIPANVRLLRQNCALNDIDATIFAAAVGRQDGELLMKLERMDYGHRVLEQPAEGAEATVKVESVSMTTLLRRLGWGRVGLLKVDIEGYERTLFAADCPWLACVDALCIECHDGFGEDELRSLAGRHRFLEPEQLPGIWLLRRRR